MAHLHVLSAFATILLIAPRTVFAQGLGTVDLTYADAGVATFDDQGVERPLHLVLRPDGGEYILGYRLDGGALATLRAVTAAGSSDVSFSNDGWHLVASPVEGESLAFTDGEIDAAGRLVVFGAIGTVYPDIDMVVQRYLPNGTLDAGLGGAQGLRMPYPGGAAIVKGAILPGGDLVFVANTEGGDLVVGRLTASGDPVSGFGTNGLQVIGPPVDHVYEAQELLVHPGGQLLIAASKGPLSAEPQPEPVVVLGLTPNGALDPAFGEGGAVEFNLSLGPQIWALQTVFGGMSLRADGSIALQLSGSDGSASQLLYPFLLDTEGNVLCVMPDPVTPQGYGVEAAVSLTSGGVLTFSSLYDGVSNIAHVLGDCTLDASLGLDGYEPLTVADAYNGYPLMAVLRTDGRVDLLMEAQTSGPIHPIIVRLHADDVVGLNERTASSVVRIAPQPVTGEGFYLESVGRPGPALQLMDHTGRAVAELTTTSTGDMDRWIALPASLGNGTYVLRGVADGRAFAVPVLVQR